MVLKYHGGLTEATCTTRFHCKTMFYDAKALFLNVGQNVCMSKSGIRGLVYVINTTVDEQQ